MRLPGVINGWSLSRRKVDSRGICGATSGTGGAVSSSWWPPFASRRKKLLLFFRPGFAAPFLGSLKDMMSENLRRELLLEGRSDSGVNASAAGASISCHSLRRALSDAKFFKNWARWSSPSKTPGLVDRRLSLCSRPYEDGGLRAERSECRAEEGTAVDVDEVEESEAGDEPLSDIKGGGTYRIGKGGDGGRNREGA